MALARLGTVGTPDAETTARSRGRHRRRLDARRTGRRAARGGTDPTAALTFSETGEATTVPIPGPDTLVAQWTEPQPARAADPSVPQLAIPQSLSYAANGALGVIVVRDVDRLGRSPWWLLAVTFVPGVVLPAHLLTRRAGRRARRVEGGRS